MLPGLFHEVEQGQR